MTHLNMAQKDVQETAEYYSWLIRIERQQFEEELLEIVSIENLWRLQQRSILLIMRNSNNINSYFQGFQ